MVPILMLYSSQPAQAGGAGFEGPRGEDDMHLRIVLALLATSCGYADSFLFKSADSGVTWTPLDPGPSYRYLFDLQLAAGPPSALYAVTLTDDKQFAVLVSWDGGQRWQSL